MALPRRRASEPRHLDLTAGTLNIGTVSTKNDDGRMVYLTPELAGLLRDQLARVKTLEKRLGAVVSYLFRHLGRRFGGKRVRDFRRL